MEEDVNDIFDTVEPKVRDEQTVEDDDGNQHQVVALWKRAANLHEHGPYQWNKQQSPGAEQKYVQLGRFRDGHGTLP
jgi:hypothetical protein